MKDEKILNPEANSDFDNIFKVELEKRLKRKPTADELINNDNDADLVNETLWQMMEKLYGRIQDLEKTK